MSLSLEELDILENTTSRPSARVLPDIFLKKTAALENHSAEKIYFFSSLAKLLKGGVPVLKAIDLAAAEIKKGSLKSALLQVRASIAEGKSINGAFQSFPGIFSHLEISVIKAGEMSGTLTGSFLRLSIELKKRENLKSRIMEAVTYPIFVLSMGVVTLLIILLFVIPKLSGIYKDFGGEIPLITKMVIAMSDCAPFLLGFLVLAAAGIFIFCKNHKNWRALEGFPVLKGLFRQFYMTHLSFLLHTLLKSGVPIHEAVSISKQSIPEKKEELGNLLEDISQGKSLAEAFKRVGFADQSERSLIAAGEESATLAETFREISESSSEEFSAGISSMLKILEPSLILVIGLVVGILVISMLLPITQIDMLAGQ